MSIVARLSALEARQSRLGRKLLEQFAARALSFAEYCALLQRGSLSWHGASQTASGEVIAGYLGEAVATGV